MAVDVAVVVAVVDGVDVAVVDAVDVAVVVGVDVAVDVWVVYSHPMKIPSAASFVADVIAAVATEQALLDVTKMASDDASQNI